MEFRARKRNFSAQLSNTLERCKLSTQRYFLPFRVFSQTSDPVTNTSRATIVRDGTFTTNPTRTFSPYLGALGVPWLHPRCLVLVHAAELEDWANHGVFPEQPLQHLSGCGGVHASCLRKTWSVREARREVQAL